MEGQDKVHMWSMPRPTSHRVCNAQFIWASPSVFPPPHLTVRAMRVHGGGRRPGIETTLYKIVMTLNQLDRYTCIHNSIANVHVFMVCSY